MLTNYVVTTTADSGYGALRSVIDRMNGDGLGGTITFDIPGTGPFVVAPGSALPALDEPVVVDGTSQPGYAGQPVVEVFGAMAGPGADGLVLSAGQSTIDGLAIDGFGGAGVVLQGEGGDRVSGNYLGVDLSGQVAAGNGDGLDIVDVSNNTIGGLTAALRNVISGNTNVGIDLSGLGANGNVIQGNYVGTDAAGTSAIPNYQGVVLVGAPSNLIGGAVPGAGNVISGNASAGVQFFNDATVFNTQPLNNPPGVASNNILQGNLIGTNAAGTGALGNQQGVFINDASSNLIGGSTPGSGNVISGNTSVGIQILGFHAAGNVVIGNEIGTDRSLTLSLGNLMGVYLYANPATNVVDTSQSSTGNVIANNPDGGLVVRPFTAGPNVESVSLVPAAGGSISAIRIVFTTYLDAASATNPKNYILTPIGNRARIAISAISYDGVYRAVTLTLATPLPLSRAFQLTVVGTSPHGVTDQLGDFLNGDINLTDLRTGSNFVATFAQGVEVQVTDSTPKQKVFAGHRSKPARRR